MENNLNFSLDRRQVQYLKWRWFIFSKTVETKFCINQFKHSKPKLSLSLAQLCPSLFWIIWHLIKKTPASPVLIVLLSFFIQTKDRFQSVYVNCVMSYTETMNMWLIIESNYVVHEVGEGGDRALLYKMNKIMLSKLFGLFVVKNALFFIKLIWHLG